MRKVTSNPVIGSVTVEYAQEELELPVLLGILQSAGIELSIPPAAHNPQILRPRPRCGVGLSPEDLPRILFWTFLSWELPASALGITV